MCEFVIWQKIRNVLHATAKNDIVSLTFLAKYALVKLLDFDKRYTAFIIMYILLIKLIHNSRTVKKRVSIFVENLT